MKKFFITALFVCVGLIVMADNPDGNATGGGNGDDGSNGDATGFVWYGWANMIDWDKVIWFDSDDFDGFDQNVKGFNGDWTYPFDPFDPNWFDGEDGVNGSRPTKPIGPGPIDF